MDENLLNLIGQCGGTIVSLLLDPVFLVLAIVTGLAWMLGGQGQHQNPHPLRIAGMAAGVLLPQAAYLGFQYWRGDGPQGFEPVATLLLSMVIASVIVMFAVFGVMLAVAFVMTVMGHTSGK